MDLSLIYSKTAKGLRARNSWIGGLPSHLMKVLSLIDGKSKAEEILAQSDKVTEQELELALTQLESEGYIRPLVTRAADDWSQSNTFASMVVEEIHHVEEIEADTLDFSNYTAEADAKANVEAERKEREGAEARAKTETERKAKEEAERKTREAEEVRAKAEAERKAKAEAERKAREEAEAQVKAEAERKAREAEAVRARAEVEEKARIEAEKNSRREMERIAHEAEQERIKSEAETRAKAEEEVRREAERKAQTEAEEKARLEAERIAREEAAAMAKTEEEARLKAEVEARGKAEQDARLEAEHKAREAEAVRVRAEAEEKARIEAEENAHREMERIAREAEQARIKSETEARAKAEQEARLEAERKAREEAEARARAEAEEEARREAERKAKAEAEEKARLEAERIAREEAIAKAKAEEEARLKAEAEARAKAEEEARLEAERKAREEAEARARAEAEEEARREAERKAKAEAEEKARLEAERIAREEAIAKAKAEEEARLKAEAEARAKAEEKARKEAERIAKEEEKARSKAEAEAMARVKEEEKAAREAEKKAQREAEKQAREEAKRVAREEAEAKAVLKAEEKASARESSGVPDSRKWVSVVIKAVLIYVPLVVLLLIGLLHTINLGMLVKPIEKIASESMGEPVTVKEVHASLWPQPHLVIGNVAIGATGLRIEAVHVLPVTSTLFEAVKVVKSLEIEGLRIEQENFGQPLKWISNSAKAERLKIEQIDLKKISLKVRDLDLGPYDGKVGLTESRELKNIELNSADHALAVQIAPQGGNFEVTLTAGNWRLPVGPHILFDELNARGTATQSQISFSQIEGKIYGGSIKGTAVVDWSSHWAASGNFDLSKASLPQMLTAFASSASMDGGLSLTANFACKSDEAAKLTDTPEVTANFELRDGKIGGIDLVRAVLAGGNQPLAGDSTGFDKLAGSVQVKNGSYQYRQLVLESAQFRAKGNVDILPNQDISGKISAELAAKSRRLQSSFSLTGKVGNVKRQ